MRFPVEFGFPTLLSIAAALPAQQHRIYTYPGTGNFTVSGVGDADRDPLHFQGQRTAVAVRHGRERRG